MEAMRSLRKKVTAYGLQICKKESASLSFREALNLAGRGEYLGEGGGKKTYFLEDLKARDEGVY